MASPNLQPAPQRRWPRSVGAVVAGMIVGAILSLATDLIMVAMGVLPRLGEPAGSVPLLYATVYRSLYGMFAAYLTARLARDRAMAHALTLGVIGLIVSMVGAVVTWNHQSPLGQHWYPVALIVLALPTAWAGGKLREAQVEHRYVVARLQQLTRRSVAAAPRRAHTYHSASRAKLRDEELGGVGVLHSDLRPRSG